MSLPEKVSFKKTITARDVDSFAQLSGDYNDLHTSDSFAAQTKFKERVVHGMLLASYFSQLVGMHLGTNKVLYLSQTLQFKNPVFIDDEISINGELKSFSESTKIATYATSIRKGETICVEGEARVMLL